ncbi:hypothetical protein D9981_17020 [Pseudoalteromonas phenolica O-BC30]|nr:hypothetical protein D9981_17020 [Pseudoalteromonas phenolica O-BC30]
MSKSSYFLKIFLEWMVTRQQLDSSEYLKYDNCIDIQLLFVMKALPEKYYLSHFNELMNFLRSTSMHLFTDKQRQQLEKIVCIK